MQKRVNLLQQKVVLRNLRFKYVIQNSSNIKFSIIYYRIKNMGQDQSITKALTQPTNSTFYELDIRLLQRLENYASSFPSEIQEIVSQSQQFYLKEPTHPVGDFFISQIDDRFNHMTLNTEAMSNASNSKTILQIFHISPLFLKNKAWFELQNKERFLKYLQSVEQKYWIQQQLYDIMERQDTAATIQTPHAKQISFQQLSSPKHGSSALGTIRKPLKPKSSQHSYVSCLRQPLFKKLFFYYYFHLIRSFCSSKNPIERSNTVQYHATIGRNILKIVQADYISEERLFQLLYGIVKIQKTERQLRLLQQMSSEYEVYCLKHQHNISVDKAKLQKIKLFAKCYLNQLYAQSIKQAQDPQIIEDSSSSDSGLFLKTFPINRVKQKNRNM